MTVSDIEQRVCLSHSRARLPPPENRRVGTQSLCSATVSRLCCERLEKLQDRRCGDTFQYTLWRSHLLPCRCWLPPPLPCSSAAPAAASAPPAAAPGPPSSSLHPDFSSWRPKPPHALERSRRRAGSSPAPAPGPLWPGRNPTAAAALLKNRTRAHEHLQRTANMIITADGCGTARTNTPKGQDRGNNGSIKKDQHSGHLEEGPWFQTASRLAAEAGRSCWGPGGPVLQGPRRAQPPRVPVGGHGSAPSMLVN